MPQVRLPRKSRLPQQRIDTIQVEQETALLTGPSVEIRLPARWARKLMPWYRGPGRTILCNADARRYNLIGVTKVGPSLILSFVDANGDLVAEHASGELIVALDGLLPESGAKEGPSLGGRVP